MSIVLKGEIEHIDLLTLVEILRINSACKSFLCKACPSHLLRDIEEIKVLNRALSNVKSAETCSDCDFSKTLSKVELILC